MTDHEFNSLKLDISDLISIHTISGSSFIGHYVGNYDNSKLEFDFENHYSGRQEKISLIDLDSIVKLPQP